MRVRKLTAYICLPSLLLLSGIANPAQNVPCDGVSLSDAAGRKVVPLAVDGRLGTCLFFISTTCPISDFYAPEISRVSVKYARKKIITYAVLTDTDLSQSAAASYRKSYRLACPVICDPNHLLVALARADVTPEAVVFDSKKRTVYRGRIDNRFADFGVERQAATEDDLVAVLNQIKPRKELKLVETKAIGCFIPPVSPVQ